MANDLAVAPGSEEPFWFKVRTTWAALTNPFVPGGTLVVLGWVAASVAAAAIGYQIGRRSR